jgi:hypothetical protein
MGLRNVEDDPVLQQQYATALDVAQQARNSSVQACDALQSGSGFCRTRASAQKDTDIAEWLSKFSGPNPEGAITETKCHEWNDKHTVQRIKVFHHGHEQAGTSHKCSLNVDKTQNKTLVYDTDIARACRCQCKSATVDEQTLQQDSKAADDEMYAIRATAQAARDHARQFNVTGDENPYQHSTDQNGNVSYEHAMHTN